MRTFQVFDTDGKVVGSVTAESIADASKKAREGYCDFPTLIEMPKDVAMSIQKVVEEKTNLEIYLVSMIAEQIVKFEKSTKVPVAGIKTWITNPNKYVIGDKLLNELHVAIELDINNIK
jgi:hypothetical protein